MISCLASYQTSICFCGSKKDAFLENIVEKGENAGKQRFLIFLLFFFFFKQPDINAKRQFHSSSLYGLVVSHSLDIRNSALFQKACLCHLSVSALTLKELTLACKKILILISKYRIILSNWKVS